MTKHAIKSVPPDIEAHLTPDERQGFLWETSADCGMGHIPPWGARFLRFFATGEGDA